MSELPVMWYVLLCLVSIFGVATWILDNFTQKYELKRITGILGVVSMISVLYITFTTEGL
mgnify:CR=1 FL=1|tara:strand:+ start:1527 stop:1706 length:180 start_codon:yes stop_codon:yes gene_type:complete